MVEPEELVEKISCVVVGAVLVGKTSIIRRFVKQDFTDNTKATQGMDISVKELNSCPALEAKRLTITIRDVSGHYTFQSLYKDFLRGADVAVIVIAQDDPSSFHGRKGTDGVPVLGIKDWIARINDANKNRHVPKILVINKNDLTENRLDEEEIEAACHEHKIVGAFRTSARTGENVNELFESVARIVLLGNLLR